jgi:hypothetical protein
MVVSAEGPTRYCGGEKVTRAESTLANKKCILNAERVYSPTALVDSFSVSKIMNLVLGRLLSLNWLRSMKFDDDSPMDSDLDPTFRYDFQYPSQPSSVRPFHIVFIPDPTLELKSKSAAINDLAFIHTQLSETEYASMKHLDGSVHSLSIIGKAVGPGRVPPKYRVCMQEWVSVLFSFRVVFYQDINTQTLFTAVYDDPPWSMA